MNNNLQTLLTALKAELNCLEVEKNNLKQQLLGLFQARTNAARNCLKSLLPDLKMSTVHTLLGLVPDFNIPTVSTWFGLSRKVDPRISIDALRLQLGAHLDNYTLGMPPISWSDQVVKIDTIIRDIQEKQLRSKAKEIIEIERKISALEKLINIDAEKLSDDTRMKLEEAVAGIQATGHDHRAKKKHSRDLEPASTPSYPDRNQIISDQGPDLLEMWFWWQILNPESQLQHEVQSLEPGGGEFGGAGASGSFESSPAVEKAPVPEQNLIPEEATSGQTDHSADPTDQATESQLSAEAELGSQSFS